MSDAPSILGKYQLLKPLARGRSGEVWKARSHGVEGFEKVVVVKRLSDALSRNDGFLARFIDEAKTAVMLTHANIAQVFDLGLEGGTYFLAMEYVRGPSLGAVLSFCAARERAVGVPLAIHIVSELAKGLDYAHRRRDAELRPLSIVHGHVAPESVLLSYEGDVKLTDFGMARAREVVWPIGALPDLVAYRSPEQVRGEVIDARADVYALGVILHELLAGVQVRAVESAQQTLTRAGQGARAMLGARFEAHPPALRALVERATAPRREARIANAGQLYEQLIEFLYESGKRVGALDLARWLEAQSGDVARSGGTLGPNSGHEVLAEIEVDLERPAPDGSRAADDGTGRPTPPASPSSYARARLPPGSEPPTGRVSAPRAEWRDVSVLLVEGAYGPELSELVARYGGVPLDAGEPPTFVFGLHDVDGRDAQAAARCALRLARSRGGERVRAIVHSGRLLVAADGTDAEPDARAALRGVALRGLRRARVGELLATAQAAPLLQSRFEVLPERAPGAHPRVLRELHAYEGLGKFVGRRDELRRIGEVFARANRGELRVLGIRGDAGAGKSRLIVEMARRLQQAGHDVAFHTAVCAPQGRSTPLSAIQAQMRAVLGLEELDAPGRAREQVDRLRLLGLSVEQRAAIARLLGLPAPRAVHSTRLSTALRRVAYKLAVERLTVFVWDGTENMDQASRALLHRLLASPLAARVLVVFAYRGDARPSAGPAAGWDVLSSFTEVHLDGLASEDLARLVRHRLGASEVQGELVQAVQCKTSGNPLFVEELLSALRHHAALSTEQGVVRLVSTPSVALPRTLRGLVAARAANLSARERLLVQLAATVGTRVTPPLLARAAELDDEIVGRSLTTLVERDILHEAREGGFTFAHHLLQEVLYEAIPLDERPALHAAIARAAEALPDEPEGTLERRAYHHRLAGQRSEAITCLTRAAEQYEAAHALEAAVDAYSQVLTLLVDDEAPSATERGRLLALHAHIGELAYHTRASEQVAERLAVALELAESWGREGYVARFAMLRGRLLNRAWRFREGKLWLDRALTMARKLGDRLLERDVALAAAEAHANNGEYTAVLPYVTDAVAAARATGDVATEVQALLLFATGAAALGQCKRARDAIAKLDELSSRHRVERHVRVMLEHVRARVFDANGELPAALSAARRALDLAKEYAFPYEVASQAHYLGGLHLRADEDKHAFAALRLSHELAAEHEFTRLRLRSVFFLGFLDAMRFDSAQGFSRMEQALAHAEERGYVVDLIDERYLLAMVAQKRGDAARAQALLQAVIELGEPHGHVRICDDADLALRAVAEGRPIPLPR